MITGKDAPATKKRFTRIDSCCFSHHASHYGSSFLSLVIIITRRTCVRERDGESDFGGDGDACGVHDACGVMYASCAAGYVRRVAYTSYMPGGSQSRVSRSLAIRIYTRVCVHEAFTRVCVYHSDTNVHILGYVQNSKAERVTTFDIATRHPATTFFSLFVTPGSLPGEGALITPWDASTCVLRCHCVKSQGDINESATGSLSGFAPPRDGTCALRPINDTAIIRLPYSYVGFLY